MSDALLHEVAKRIAQEQFLSQWPLYALMLAVALVVGFSSAYIGAYAKKRGETLATKSDFDLLLAQMKAMTAVAEDVKVQISHADWMNREFKTLRRIKLEELLSSVYQLTAWQDVDRSFRIYKSGIDAGPSPMPRIELLAGLYFPELQSLMHEHCQVHRRMGIKVLEVQSKLVAAETDTKAQITLREEFALAWRSLYQAQLLSVSAIERKCREVMSGLVGA